MENVENLWIIENVENQRYSLSHLLKSSYVIDNIIILYINRIPNKTTEYKYQKTFNSKDQ